MNKNILRSTIFGSILFGLFISHTAFAGTAILNWNANTEPDIASYKIYYGTSSRSGTDPKTCGLCGYSSSVSVGNVLTYTFSNLTDGLTYYFSTSAYDTSNNESSFSSEVSKIIPVVDTTASVLSNGSPSGSQSAGTTQRTLSLTTNENSTCRYSVSPGTSYSLMGNTFSTTGGTNHSQTLTGLIDGTSYNYYARCQDATGNANTTDYSISFSVASVPVSCSESWSCSGWLDCSNSSQGRTCSDSNNCGTINSKPAVSQSCSSAVVSPPPVVSTSVSSGGGGGGGIFPPTTIVNPPPVEVLLPVVVRDLKIIKEENKSAIAEGQTINSSTVIFEAFVFDSDNNQVRLEVELRKDSEPFTGTPTIVSDYVNPGLIIQLKRSGLADGKYKLRAMTRRSSAPSDLPSDVLTSDWLDFGDRNVMDFTINTSSAITSRASLPPVKGPFSVNTQSSEVILLKQILVALGFDIKDQNNQYNQETVSIIQSFQKKYNISQTGLAGPITRAKINELYREIIPVQQTTQKTTRLSSTLQRGSKSDEVKTLQEMLSRDKEIYPEQSIIGIFGPATQRAVIRFQKKYNITPPMGIVGPITRAKLNELYGR